MANVKAKADEVVEEPVVAPVEEAPESEEVAPEAEQAEEASEAPAEEEAEGDEPQVAVAAGVAEADRDWYNKTYGY